MPEATRQPVTDSSRVIHIILASVIALAFVGFVVGTRGAHTPRLAGDGRELLDRQHEDEGPVHPAMRYSEIPGSRLSPNRNWRSILADLDQPERDLFADVAIDARAKSELLALRAMRRAYPGAPPVVPHAIDQMTSAACMACHGNGLRLPDNRIASKMPHEYLPNCTQCHVEQNALDLPPFELAQNFFQPLDSPVSGTRAWPGAPPTIPHGTFMRSDCMACHGVIAHEPLRTSHPWQTNCLQCHAPSANWDQVARESPGFLPPPIVIKP